MKYLITLLVVLSASFQLFADDNSPDLGNGEPGLSIIYSSTNAYVIFINEAIRKSWKTEGGWPPEYGQVPVQIIAGQGLVTGKPSSSSTLSLQNAEDLFPFDEQTVFTRPVGTLDTRVFSKKADAILISNDVDALARARYCLTTNEWFLGKIGTNIYYWQTREPNKVYFRTVEEHRAVNYFKLAKADSIICGVKKAVSTNEDIGFCVIRKLSWYEVLKNMGTVVGRPAFVEFSFTNAKHIKGGHF